MDEPDKRSWIERLVYVDQGDGWEPAEDGYPKPGPNFRPVGPGYAVRFMDDTTLEWENGYLAVVGWDLVDDEWHPVVRFFAGLRVVTERHDICMAPGIFPDRDR